MASLREYFEHDFNNNVRLSTNLTMPERFGSAIISVKVHLDFAARAKFLSFYVPESQFANQFVRSLLVDVEQIMEMGDFENIRVAERRPGSDQRWSESLIFTGMIYIYHASLIDNDFKT